jgi:threonine dehydratase
MLNRLLSNPIPASGVIVASGGNAGIATAAAARAGRALRGVRAHRLSPAKQAKLRELGAEVVVTGAVYAEALEACLARQRETGALLTHAYDQPEVLAGAGTLARGDRAAGRRARQRCW